MARKDPPEEPFLFDLPLGKGGGSDAAAAEGRQGARKGERRAGAEHLRALEIPLEDRTPAEVASPDPEWDGPAVTASRSARLLAGLADGVMHAAMVALGVIGARQVGVRPVLADWPGFVLFLLAFSFLYVVVSLAFWGHTLGMAWVGLSSRSRDGEALSFDQAVRRWLGGILSACLLGLPLLFAFRGRTLSDLISSSETLGR